MEGGLADVGDERGTEGKKRLMELGVGAAGVGAATRRHDSRRSAVRPGRLQWGSVACRKAAAL